MKLAIYIPLILLNKAELNKRAKRKITILFLDIKRAFNNVFKH
jgi:hypothetical protein